MRETAGGFRYGLPVDVIRSEAEEGVEVTFSALNGGQEKIQLQYQSILSSS